MDETRKQIVKLVYEKGEAHIGSCLSCVEILQEIKGKMVEGDKFILSKAHAQRAADVIGMPGVVKELVCYGGSLGNGIGIGLGIALGAPDICVYVLVGDGEMDEGSNWEAINYARYHDIKNLRVYIDFNGWSSYRRTAGFQLIKNRYPFITPWTTTKCKGIPELEDKLESHYHKITKEEYERWTA